MDGYLEKPSSCLEKDLEGNVILERNHQYFYQVQHQMFTTELPFCDFVVFGFAASQSAFHYERITPTKTTGTEFFHYCLSLGNIRYSRKFLVDGTQASVTCQNHKRLLVK